MSTWADAVGMGDGGMPFPADSPPIPLRATAEAVGRIKAGLAQFAVQSNPEPVHTPVDTQPPPHVLRVAPFNASGQSAGSRTSPHIVRCVNGGWWWVNPDDEQIPVRGWAWRGANMHDVTTWVDATSDDDIARFDGVKTYTFAGDPPPMGIVRLRLEPEMNRSDRDLARVQPDNRWWFVDRDQAPPPARTADEGWPWDHGGTSQDDQVLVPFYPLLDPTAGDEKPDGKMLRSLVRALPDDGEWYWIAYDRRDGKFNNDRIYAYREGDGDVDGDEDSWGYDARSEGDW